MVVSPLVRTAVSRTCAPTDWWIESGIKTRAQPDFVAKLARIATNLNVDTCKLPGEGNELVCSAHLEAHMGLDAHYYLLNYAHVLPPESGTADGSYQVHCAALHCLLC